MPTFPDFIRQNLQRSGYRLISQSDGDVFIRTPSDEPVWICYLDAALPPEIIRRAFEFTGHLLFVVDDKLIPQDITDRQSTPMWLRVLHGLYMGRIYTWNGRFLYGLHFDYDNGVINESGAIAPDELLLTEHETWLRGWPGTYKVARFYDRAWWMGNGYPRGGAGYSQDNWREYTQQREKAQRQQYDASGWAYDPNDWPNGKPPDPPKKESMRDFGKEFRACDTLDEVKQLWRKLAKEYHPDFNPDKDTTVIMQAINAAYDRAKKVYA